MTRNLIMWLFLFMMVSCQKNEPNAQNIVDRAIEFSGGEAYQKLNLEYDFRGRHYVSQRDDGNFEYKRIRRDSLGETIDSYSNSVSLRRTINGRVEEVPDSLASRIMNSINSVNYFVLLPFGLNDPAVNKTYIGEVVIKDKPYHKIQVTFDEEGGGTDFEDVFIYWIHKDEYSMDYLAYRYYTNGGGLRFREAFNSRMINGIRFSDYNNYKPKDKDVKLEDLDRLFEAGELDLLSVIETENIKLN